MYEFKRFQGFAFALLLILIGEFALAQVPQGIPYQAIARNGQGQALANLPVNVRFSVLDSILTGPVVYSETHQSTTSAQGLFSVNVGMGNSTIGSFSSITWGVNAKFLKVELDTTATGSNYIDLGTQQMMSVPYALFAKYVENDDVIDGDTTYWKSNGNSIYFNGGNVGIGTNNPLNLFEVMNSTTSFRLLNSGGSYFKRNAGSVIAIHNTDNTFNSDLSSIVFYRGNGNGTLAYLSNISDGSNGIRGIGFSFGPNKSFYLMNNGVVNISPQTSTPTNPQKGDMYFDNNSNKLRVWDGVTWQNCW